MKLMKQVNSGSWTVSPSGNKPAPGKTDHKGCERLTAGGSVQTEDGRLVFTSHIRPSRLPLCSNRRVLSERRAAHAGGRLKGHEGGQVLVWRARFLQRHAALMCSEFHLFFKRKKFPHVGQLCKVGELEQPRGSFGFSRRCRARLAFWEKHQGRPKSNESAERQLLLPGQSSHALPGCKRHLTATSSAQRDG